MALAAVLAASAAHAAPLRLTAIDRSETGYNSNAQLQSDGSIYYTKYDVAGRTGVYAVQRTPTGQFVRRSPNVAVQLTLYASAGSVAYATESNDASGNLLAGNIYRSHDASLAKLIYTAPNAIGTVAQAQGWSLPQLAFNPAGDFTFDQYIYGLDGAGSSTDDQRAVIVPVAGGTVPDLGAGSAAYTNAGNRFVIVTANAFIKYGANLANLFTLVAGDAVPGHSGERIDSIVGCWIGQAGTIYASVSTHIGTAPSQLSLIQIAGSSSRHIVSAGDTIVISGQTYVTNGSVGRVRLGRLGQMFFTIDVQPSGNMTAPFATLLVEDVGGRLTPISIDGYGAAIPGVPSLGLSGVVANAQGRLIFTSTNSDASGTHHALYTWTETGGLQKVIGEGDTVMIDGAAQVVTGDSLLYSERFGAALGRTYFNDRGQFLVQLHSADSRQGLYLGMLPAPLVAAVR
jgi:hypothetical protein